MTSTMDDDQLRELFEASANGFDVPEAGPQRILAVALGPDAARGRTPVVAAIVPRRRGARAVLATAAGLAVAVAIALPLVMSAEPSKGQLAFRGPAAPLYSSSHSSARFAAGGLGAINGTASGAPFGWKLTQDTSTHGTAGVPSQRATDATKVVSVGTVTVRVPTARVQVAVTSLTALATRLGGYVASSHVTLGGAVTTPSSAVIVLRVPESHYAALVASVTRVGRVTSVNTTSTDVTSEFVDLHARIAALEVSRQQYLAIMGRATSISDVLAIQAQVNAIQSQIEQLQGQQNLLANEAAYGTLTAVVNNGVAGGRGHANAQGVAKAWDDGVQGVIVGFEWVIRLTGPTLFVLLCLALLALAGRAAWRISRRRML